MDSFIELASRSLIVDDEMQVGVIKVSPETGYGNFARYEQRWVQPRDTQGGFDPGLGAQDCNYAGCRGFFYPGGAWGEPEIVIQMLLDKGFKQMEEYPENALEGKTRPAPGFEVSIPSQVQVIDEPKSLVKIDDSSMTFRVEAEKLPRKVLFAGDRKADGVRQLVIFQYIPLSNRYQVFWRMFDVFAE